jgi:thiol reductant ABC exporter CydD subunit
VSARAVHRRLLGLAPRARLLLGGAVAAGGVGAALLVVQAAAIARIVDGAAFGGEGLHALRETFARLAAALAGRALLAAATEWLGRRAAERAMGELRRRVGAEVLSARARQVEEARRGELATAAVHGVDALADYYAKTVPQVALAAFVPVGLVVAVAWRDLPVAILLALTLPLVVVFMVLVGKASAERVAERRQALGVLGSHFLDVVRGLPTLRAHGRAEAQAETLGAIGERYRLESVAALRVAFLSALVLELLAMVGTAVAAAVVGVQLAGGSLGFEAGLFVLLLAPEVYVPLRLAGQRYHAAEDGAAAAGALLDWIGDGDEPITATPGVQETPRVAVSPAGATIALRGVTVRGGAGRPPALDGVDLTIAPGRTTALVGASGAGKSTLLALLALLRDPDAGEVVVGGGAAADRLAAAAGGAAADVAPPSSAGAVALASLGAVPLSVLTRETWWREVAWLGQRPALLRGPLRETLLLQAPDATAQELAVALDRADATAVVESLERGIETVVGPGGRTVSGGQRQRLALAGALLSRAPLLLLDEPTAHLDPASAARAAAGIRAAAAGRTCVVATHDPAVVAVCDHVVELAGGRVLSATAAELVAA